MAAIPGLIQLTDLNAKGTLQVNPFSDSVYTTLFDNIVLEKQEILLKACLGDDLYIALETDLDGGATATAQKWIDFLEGVRYTDVDRKGNNVQIDYRGFKFLLAYYIFYWFARGVVNSQSGAGFTIPSQENAVLYFPIKNGVAAYNRAIQLFGIDWNNLFFDYQGHYLVYGDSIHGKQKYVGSYHCRGYKSRWYIDIGSARIMPTAYNYLRKSNDDNATNFPNWLFTQLENMTITGL